MATTPLNLGATVPQSSMWSGVPPISNEWRLFFTSLLNRTGGGQGTDVNNVKIKIAQITDAGATGAAVLAASTPLAAREAMGAGTSNLTLQSIEQALVGQGIVFGYDPTTQTIEASLSPTGVAAGTYGGTGQDLQITLGVDGRVTSAQSSPAVPDIASLWVYA